MTDGLGCWSALDEAACSHQAIRTGSGRQAARMASFKWVNTTLGNIKSAITGTYRKLGPDHAGRYLASFAWRYNRRYQLQTMIPRFVHSAARTQPLPYRLGDVCSQYVLHEGVTVMGFKVASRVRGLSDEAFREAFGTKEQCRAALVRLRWPDGFVCPCCGHREHCVLAGRGLYQCNRCKKQTSPTAGTIFHATKLPLTLWFAAIHLVVMAKNGISSVELGRRLGVKQPTAWAVKHKIMAVMARREGETRLTGRVEMDDAYLGGVRSGGKRGRGAAGKTPFVAAVSTSPEGRPRKLKLAPVKGFRKREIARGAKHWLAPGAAVVTDGLGCWSALDEAACSHQAIRTGSGRQAARMASFKWVNTTLGNIKSAITGTYRKLGPDHAGRYLASFAWRYNRRYQLQTMIPRFVHSAARTQPLPYRLLIARCLSGISRKIFGPIAHPLALRQGDLRLAKHAGSLFG